MRLRENFGNRQFVHRLVRYNLSTFLEDGALREGPKKRVHVRGRIMKPRVDPEETASPVEALLHPQDGSNLQVQMIIAYRTLFPFEGRW